MEQIYQSKHFGHIDLSKIITVSDAWISGGGQYVGFNVRVLSRDEPLKYERLLKDDAERCWVGGYTNGAGDRIEPYWEIRTDVGEWKRNLRINTDNDYTAAQYNLQEEINVLIQAWKSYSTAYTVANFPREPSPQCQFRRPTW